MSWKCLSERQHLGSRLLPSQAVGIRKAIWSTKKAGPSRSLILFLSIHQLTFYHWVYINKHDWTLRKMVEKAWQWGLKTKNIRVNDIHCEEECRLILSDTFEATQKNSEQIDRTGQMDIQDVPRGEACMTLHISFQDVFVWCTYLSLDIFINSSLSIYIVFFVFISFIYLSTLLDILLSMYLSI